MKKLLPVDVQKEARDFLVELREVDREMEATQRDVDILRVHIQELTGTILLVDRCQGCEIRFLADEWPDRYTDQAGRNWHPGCYQEAHSQDKWA